MSDPVSSFKPSGLFEAQPNDVRVPGEQERQQQHQQTFAPTSASALPSSRLGEAGTLIGGGSLGAGQPTTLNQLAGQQPIESRSQIGAGPGNLPRTPLFQGSSSEPGNLPRTPIFPGAYPGNESPLNYPPVSDIPVIAMNTLQTVNETIQNVGEKVAEYVPEGVSSYFPHSKQGSIDARAPEHSASAPVATLVPDWPRDAAKLDEAPAPPNVPNLHPGAKAALDDAEFVQDKALSDAYANDITNLDSHPGEFTNKGQPVGSMVASNAAYVKDKALDAVHAVGGTLGNAGSAVASSLPETVSSYLPNKSTNNDATSHNTTSTNTSGAPSYLGALASAPSQGSYASNFASTDASTRTLRGSVTTPGNADNNSSNYTYDYTNPPTLRLPSFLEGQELDKSVSLGTFDHPADQDVRRNKADQPDSGGKPILAGLDHAVATSTSVAKPDWKNTAAFPTGDASGGVNRGASEYAAPSPTIDGPEHKGVTSAGVGKYESKKPSAFADAVGSGNMKSPSSTTCTPGHEVPASNMSRIHTHPPTGLSSNKTVDVAESTSIPPLTKQVDPTTHASEVARATHVKPLDKQTHSQTGPSLGEASSKSLPTTPTASHNASGVLNGGGQEVRREAKAKGVEIVPAVPGEHGHVGFAREVTGDVEPTMDKHRLDSVKEEDGFGKDGPAKLTKRKSQPADSFTLAKEHGASTTKHENTHPGTYADAPVTGNTAGATHPQTTPSKLTKHTHAERDTSRRTSIPDGMATDRHLDPNSHVSPPSPKKPGFMDKIRGEMKVVSGKMSKNDEKIEEGKRMMGKLQN